jgi:hypothetical protein
MSLYLKNFEYKLSQALLSDVKELSYLEGISFPPGMNHIEQYN